MQQVKTMGDTEIRTLINSLTLEEKAALCSGADSWTTKPNAEKGIPALRMADGPHGIRREAPDRMQENGGASMPATCFPPEVTLACTWDTGLMHQVGQALGAEARDQGVRLLLGPGVNIKRSPLCGRNFEYFSEDPVLSGEMAAAWINGVQSCGVGASIKHFALNNQEHKRMSISSLADERAFFDIYLKAFEIAVKKSSPATVMASYNKIGETYACSSRRLLCDILRLRFGFDGVAISDWGAVDSRTAGIFAGLDLEMPGSGGVNDAEIVKAVKHGIITEDTLDTACWNLLRLIFKYAETESTPPPCNYGEHDELAATAAAKGAVLLKNSEAVLPFDKDEKLVVIGQMAKKPRYQGGGSSIVNPKMLTSFTSALDAAGADYEYHPGYEGYETDIAMITEAAKAAKGAKQVVLFLGLPELYECEGYDREHLSLPENQLKLLTAVTNVCQNIVVALCCGGAVETPWLGKIKGLICLHLGGQAGGEGARRVLFGDETPGGKLTESWPLKLEDTPCYHHYPMGPQNVTYNESIYVGYRYYSTAKKAVQFPFGFGLSYTRFEYSNIILSRKTLSPGAEAQISFTVTNTGSVQGDEISQLYISNNSSAMYQPAQELAGFARTTLKPGESKKVTIPLNYTTLTRCEPASGMAVVEEGEYGVYVGGNCQSLPLSGSIRVVKGTKLAPAPAFEKTGWYGNIKDNTFPAEKFEAIYGKPLPKNTPVQKGMYTMHTTLGEMKESAIVRRLTKLVLAFAGGRLNFSTDKAAEKKALEKGIEDLPFKNLVNLSGGAVSHEAAEILLSACNGGGGFIKGLNMVRKSFAEIKKKKQI